MNAFRLLAMAPYKLCCTIAPEQELGDLPSNVEQSSNETFKDLNSTNFVISNSDQYICSLLTVLTLEDCIFPLPKLNVLETSAWNVSGIFGLNIMLIYLSPQWN
tara:strand:+ start:900 stop:1211 length:312 start_codon:yes stop_codon:yes gene_type:complete